MSMLSTKGIYGMMAIYEIAKGSKEAPLSIKEIAQKTEISRNYLEQILNLLRNANIIQSIKGVKGGYFLSKSLDELTFLEIFNALESDFSLYSSKIDNQIYRLFLDDCSAKICEIFNQPISKLENFKDDSKKYLNYNI